VEQLQHVLRPGEALRARAGAGNGGGMRGSRQELWWPWHARRRTARKGSRPGEGEGRRVESARAGGGAEEELERRWAALTAGGRGEAEEQSRGARGRRRGEGVRGTRLQK
jgi:hypothetical protein